MRHKALLGILTVFAFLALNGLPTTASLQAADVEVSGADNDGSVQLFPRQPQVNTVLTATLHDPNLGSATVTWAWEESIDKTSWAAITGETANTYTPVTANIGNYLRATATYYDGHANQTESAVSEFTVRDAPPTNTSPDFSTATTNLSVQESTAGGQPIGTPVTVNVHDPSLETESVTVTITVTEAATGSVRGNTQRASGSRIMTAIADDPPSGLNFIASDPVIIRVPESTPPATDIGEPLTATDADPSELVYSIVDWRDGGSFNIHAGTGQLKTKDPLDYETKSSYQLRVQVRDDNDGTDRITIQVQVTDMPEPPTLTGDQAIEVAENSTGSLATYSAIASEGSVITWRLSGADASRFSITNQVLSFASTPDYDSPVDSDGDNVYHVTVQASAGSLTAELAVTVTVTNLVDDFRIEPVTSDEDRGPASDAITQTYLENETSAVASYHAVEPQGDNIEWSLDGDDSHLFSITDGVLSFESSPDYESSQDSDGDNNYAVTVQANDGTETVSLDVTVQVADVNEPFTLTGASSADYAEQGTGSVATYTGVDPEGAAITWSLSGVDGGHFSIDGGVLSFSSRPDYEEPSDSNSENVYAVTVEASDGMYSDSIDLSVTVTDIQEVPVINGATQTVALVLPDSDSTIETPDEVARLSLPSGSRTNPYFVRVDSDVGNCGVGFSEDGSSDDGDDSSDDTVDSTSGEELRVCLTVLVFDTWGTQETGVSFSQAARAFLTIDADDLGGVDPALQTHEMGGINTYVLSSTDGEWSEVGFLFAIGDGLITITVSDVTSPHKFAATTDTGILSAVLVGTTPAAQPRPNMASSMVMRLPPPPRHAYATGTTTPDLEPQSHLEAATRFVIKQITSAPLWALILMVLGGLTLLCGSGALVVPKIMSPPKWARLPRIMTDT